MDGIGTKSRSLGQICVKSCLRSGGNRFDPIFLKLSHNRCLGDSWVRFDNGLNYVKSRSQGQICLKLSQNVCLDDIWVNVEHGLGRLKK